MKALTSNPAPRSPGLLPQRLRPSDHLVRGITAAVISASRGRVDTYDRAVEKIYPDDRVLPLLTRAAVSPQTLAADPIASAVVSDFFVSLGSVSAGAAVLARGIQFKLDGSGMFLVPNVVSAAAGASFVGEGTPIPFRQLSVSSSVLTVRKLAVSVGMSREVFAHSLPNIEQIVRTVLLESTAGQLDTIMFDANAGDTVRPPGLLNGIGAATKSNSTDAMTAMAADISTLTSAVRAVGGNNPILVIMSSAQAQRFKLRMLGGSDYDFELFATSALADGVIVAIASNALVSLISPAALITGSAEGTVVTDDAPGQITDAAGNPSANVRSLFQTDSLGLQVVFEVAWGLRSTSGLVAPQGPLAWLTGITAW